MLLKLSLVIDQTVNWKEGLLGFSVRICGVLVLLLPTLLPVSLLAQPDERLQIVIDSLEEERAAVENKKITLEKRIAQIDSLVSSLKNKLLYRDLQTAEVKGILVSTGPFDF